MHWYCIHTRPKKEAQVASYFHTVLGLQTYFPRIREQRVIRRVRRTVTGPLFPRYLFCQFDPSGSYRAVRFAPEVLDIVHQGDRPALVRETLIDDLKGWAGDAIDVITLHPPLQAGDQVEITDGPMRGLRAVIVRANDGQDRVAILLSILECGAQMNVSRSDLRRVG